MRRRFLFLLLAVGLALVATQVASPRTLLSTFTDPAGDSGAAPDLTTVTADNDTSGNITITITTNQATLASDAVLFVAIDADQNPSTGQGGIDFLFDLDATGYGFGMWNGTDFVNAPNTTVHVFYSSGVARFVLNKSELGNTSAFNFFVFSVQISGGATAARDLAPDSGAYSHTLAAPPPPPPPPLLRRLRPRRPLSGSERSR